MENKMPFLGKIKCRNLWKIVYHLHPSGAGLFKAVNAWYATPKPGDIIYFRNTSRISHVGLVHKVADGVVYTIEGNTSNGSAVIPNGGGVCKKSYSLSNSRIAGYGRPKYDDTTIVYGNKTISKGQSNANKFLKNHLTSAPVIDVDGERGPQTRKQYARVVQKAVNLDYNSGLVSDGEIGPKSKAALKGKSIKKGDKRYLCLAAKILYQCKGKDEGMKYSRTYGSGLVKTAGKEKITADELLELLS